MIRFAIKVGLAYGAIYYIREEDVWKESSKSLKNYDKINQVYTTYAKDHVDSYIPKSVAEKYNSVFGGAGRSSVLEKSANLWNYSILGTFEFISELPGKSKRWSNEGVEKVREYINSQKKETK